MASALEPVGGFASLQQFFTRALRPGLRPIAPSPGVLVAPVDGMVGACGRIEHDQLLQAKGRFYSLAALLGDATISQRFDGGLFCTLYLAPADYHRVHAPESGTVHEVRHIPGTFYPVNPRAVATIPGLFAGNERFITYLDTTRGRVALVMVGACLVGSIRMRYQPPYPIARGEELGHFEFGSTVILLTEPATRLRLSAAAGTRIQMGATLMS